MGFSRRFSRRRSSKARPRSMGILALGAFAALAAAYFLDPTNGKRRRDALSGRLSGLLTRKGQPNDATLADKIRSEVLGSYGSESINVNVENGVAVLRGSVASQDLIDEIEQKVRKVSGVIDVRNLLHVQG